MNGLWDRKNMKIMESIHQIQYPANTMFEKKMIKKRIKLFNNNQKKILEKNSPKLKNIICILKCPQ